MTNNTLLTGFLFRQNFITFFITSKNFSATDFMVGEKPRAWLNDNAMFYKTFICFYVSEAKPLCFSLCSQMFDDVEQC